MWTHTIKPVKMEAVKFQKTNICSSTLSVSEVSADILFKQKWLCTECLNGDLNGLIRPLTSFPL